MNKIHAGEPVFDKVTSNELTLERTMPIHAICLVPDLSLVNFSAEPCELLERFAERNADFLHILDTCQLFRVVQAAHMLSDAGKVSAPLSAFDHLLEKRAKYTAALNDFDFDMALDLNSDPPRIRIEH